MADVFISYASENREFALKLRDAITASAKSVWIDQGLHTGEYRLQIAEELRAARAVVVIWTPDSIESRWVLDEADRASNQKKLVPIQVRPTDPSGAAMGFEIPLGFGQIHALDFTNWLGDPDAPQVKSLMENLAKVEAKRWAELLSRTTGAARVDAARFFQNISTELAGLALSKLFIGSVGLASLGATIAATGMALRQAPDSMTALYLIPIWVTLVAIARGLHQFVTVTSGKSSRQFFDDTFTLVFLVSLMISLLLITWAIYINRAAFEPAPLFSVMVLAPALTLFAMLGIGLLRSFTTGLGLLFARL